ncbi:hypothetical protein HID58_092982 [Brassica napus]|uniref:Uncharacterized protein n=1 Tax=Brassica napus TaxID=3708 RepID=A0ABQ7XF30_BRANA|nr:hypothetical protein HID58_092982 [Brassica napus]
MEKTLATPDNARSLSPSSSAAVKSRTGGFERRTKRRLSQTKASVCVSGQEEDDEEEVKEKIEALQRIIPGGTALGVDALFEETAVAFIVHASPAFDSGIRWLSQHRYRRLNPGLFRLYFDCRFSFCIAHLSLDLALRSFPLLRFERLFSSLMKLRSVSLGFRLRCDSPLLVELRRRASSLAPVEDDGWIS